MDLSGISTLAATQQAFTAGEAHALVLEVGQQMTATILEMVDSLVLLDVGGGRTLSATLQTEQQLAPGQTVHLVAADVQPQQITLRLVAEQLPAGTSGRQALASVGLADDPVNHAAFIALVSEGQSVSAETIQTLKQAAFSLGASTINGFRAVAYLLARDLPLTPTMMAVVAEGQINGFDPKELESQLRNQAGQLLTLLEGAAPGLDTLTPDLHSLLRQLAAAPAMPPQSAPTLGALLQQLTMSVEATLLQSLEGEQPASIPLSAASELPVAAGLQANEQSGTDATGAAGTQEPNATPAESSPLPAGTSETSPQSAGELPPSIASAPAESEVLQTPAEAAPAGGAMPQAPSASLAPGAPIAGSPPPEIAITASVLPAAVLAEAAAPSPAEGSVFQVPVAPSDGHAQPTLPGLPLPAQQPSSHELARRLIPALDRALGTGAPSAAVSTAGAELRHTAERFVQTVQSQQLQTILQPTAAEPYVVFALPVPNQQGEAGLRLYVRDDAGRARIDPDDIRVAIDLHLSQLRRVSVLVHVFHRQLTCTIETDSLSTQRLLEGAVRELRQSLRDLGFAVDPIHCSMAGFSSRDTTEVELPLSKLGAFDVHA